jgi:hypothetical protein
MPRVTVLIATSGLPFLLIREAATSKKFISTAKFAAGLFLFAAFGLQKQKNTWSNFYRDNLFVQNVQTFVQA